MDEVKTFSIDTRWGRFFGAVGPRGLVAATLPHLDDQRPEARLEKLLAARAPGCHMVVVPAESLPAGRKMAGYLSGASKGMKVKLDLEGLSPFTAQVLEVVSRIPFGRTRSYGEVAAEAGSPGAARAVGRAMAANPLPLFVPCHRVIGADGNLTGFGGGLELKQALLELEGRR